MSESVCCLTFATNFCESNRTTAGQMLRELFPSLRIADSLVDLRGHHSEIPTQITIHWLFFKYMFVIPLPHFS
jgi:hypothetical protein